jgi:hypothetical protein
MSEEPLEPLPPELAELLRAEQRRAPVSSDVSARLAIKLGASIGAFPSSLGSGATPGTGQGLAVTKVAATSAVASGKVLPWVGLVVALGGAAAGVKLHSGAFHSTRPPAAGVAVERVVSTRAPVVPPVALVEPRSTAEPTSVVAPPTPNTPPIMVASPGVAPPRVRTDASVRKDAGLPDASAAAERSLIEQARTSLAHSRWVEALWSLDRHRLRFAQGTMSEERESMRVRALVMLHRHDEARMVADGFRQRYPESRFAASVEQAIQAIP